MFLGFKCGQSVCGFLIGIYSAEGINSLLLTFRRKLVYTSKGLFEDVGCLGYTIDFGVSLSLSLPVM